VAVKRARKLWLGLLGVVIVLAAAATALFEFSGASLAGDSAALARVRVEPFGGTLQSARAIGPGGAAIPVAEAGGKLTPREKIAPGQTVTVEVVLERPGWDGWLIGKTKRERLTVKAPVAHVTSHWVNAADGVGVRFSEPVTTVAYRGRTVRGTRTALSIPAPAPAGTVKVRVAARTWESLGPAATVHWFPRAQRPVALVSPAPGGKLSPADPLRLTFSETVAKALGKAQPKLSPAVSGHWRRVDSHTLEFTPSGFGVALGTHEKLSLPHTAALADAEGRGLQTSREVDWTVPGPTTLRQHQLLAQLGYLPVGWKPAGAPVARTERAQAGAAAEPPDGTFSWRYANTPKELQGLWKPGARSEITQGAVMMFQDKHHLTVDGIAGAAVWKALIADAIAGRRRTDGYSYVYVHRDVPQLLTLWHNGHTVLTSPGNTGVPAAPTDLGTFPVFEHLAVTTMSGTNPDGSSYNDPGIKWVSYFNGGDALHAFPRASFGTPQSLGCVELPEAAAQKIWPYTPIGALVTIEN
jgi:peptidoglycan hydrolase-like protein with peptidoglycan-binding domain